VSEPKKSDAKLREEEKIKRGSETEEEAQHIAAC